MSKNGAYKNGGLRLEYRHDFHIMPPAGWLNDPNGSCFFKGKYYIFFQYSPDSPEGGSKYWGRYESEDLLHFKFTGIAVKPDSDADAGGAYSGTAYTGDGEMEIFYTGNVKHKGNFDYINEGREHNVIYIKSSDGENFGSKKVLLRNCDYPDSLSCHVRDPKVFRDKGIYKMLLGARTRDSKAALLVMNSEDKIHWNIEKLMTAPEDMGYMWECPDFFILSSHPVVSVCPQGMASQEFKFQNIYQSGYFSDVNYDKIDSDAKQGQFKEWDSGFDFYAPQTFETQDKRRVLVGWAGVPDAPYDNEPSVKEGWQHSMTLIRELTFKNGAILQNPVKEYEKLRGKPLEFKRKSEVSLSGNEDYGSASSSEEEFVTKTREKAFDIVFSCRADSGTDKETKIIDLNGDLILSHEGSVLSLKFMNDTGRGRDLRKCVCNQVRDVRVLMDHSLVEIYVNGGSHVFTTRYYPEDEILDISVTACTDLRAWSMDRCIKWEN